MCRAALPVESSCAQDPLDLEQVVEVVASFKRDKVGDGLPATNFVDAVAGVPLPARH